MKESLPTTENYSDNHGGSDVKDLLYLGLTNEQRQIRESIQSDDGYEIATNLIDKIETIPESQLKWLVEELLYHQGPAVTHRLDKFDSLDRKWLAETLIHYRYGSAIIDNPNKFPNLDSTWLASQLISYHQTHLVMAHLDIFVDLDHQWLAKELLNSNQRRLLVDNLDKLENIDRDWLADQLIESGCEQLILENLTKFPNLDLMSLATRMVDNHDEIQLSEHLEKFDPVDKLWLANILINSRNAWALFRNANKLEGINLNWLAKALFDQDQGYYVATQLDIFLPSVDRDWLVEQLAAAGHSHVVFENFSEFPGVDLKWLAEETINAGRAQNLMPYLSLFDPADKPWLAEKLLDARQGRQVVANLRQFEDLDRRWLAKRLIELQQADIIGLYLEEFATIDRQWLADELIMAREGSIVVNFLDRFPGTDQHKIIDQLIENNQGESIFSNLDGFTQIDTPWLLEKLLAAHLESGIAEHLPRFCGNDCRPLIDRLIKTGIPGVSIALNLVPYASLLDTETKELLFSKAYLLPKDHPEIVELAEYQSPAAIARLQSLGEDDRDKLAAFYRDNQYYKSLQLLINNFGYDAKKLEWSWEVVIQNIYALVENQNLAHAHDLLTCAKTLFPNMQVEIENIEKTLPPTRELSEQEYRSPFEKLDCLREIFDYYANLILINSSEIAALPSEIKDQILTPIESLFKKVREYILLAVSSEIKHTPDLRGVNRYGENNNSMYFTSQNEVVRLFFERCASNFRTTMAGNTLFGGEAWANIADFGKQIWADDVETNWEKKIFLLNIIVGIQHNSGYFFDKDPHRVKLVEYKLKDLLDFEASSDHSLESFLHYGLENQIIDQTDHDRYLALQDQIKQEQSLKNLAPELVHQLFVKKINRQISTIVQDPNLPHEIRLSISNYFKPDQGFVVEQNGFTGLGRLLDTMNLDWQESNQLIQKLTKDEQTFYLISVEGFKLGYWYENGELKLIKNQRELHNLTPQLSELLGKQIVKAQFSNLREGD